MKMTKIAAVAVGVIIVVVIAATVALLQNKNRLVKRIVEQTGSDVTQTSVQLESVNIQLKQGRGELAGLTIANPKGFSNSSLFTLGDIVFDTDPLSLLGEVIVIDELVISGVNINAEHIGVRDTNLQALWQNIKASMGPSGAASDSEVVAEDGKEVLLAVKKLTFAENSLSFSSEKLGSYQLAIPGFELTNLGSKEAGLTPAELAQAIIRPLLDKARSKVEKSLKETAQDELEDKAKQKLEEKLDDEQKEKLEGLKSLLKGG